VPSGTPLYSPDCLYTFSLTKGDPPTSYVYVRVITPLSLHRYTYIDHYKFSAPLMLAHKQINENMVIGHQKSVGKHVSIITACISCNLNNINHEHGKMHCTTCTFGTLEELTCICPNVFPSFYSITLFVVMLLFRKRRCRNGT
jgi:hypothetical protein